jgi:hypothetical protein
MPLLQLIYTSQPFGFDEPTLAGILLDARRCNARDGVTGALICRDDLFVQLLEGPEDKVKATYARIIVDDRHLEVRKMASRPIGAADRLFAGWAMRDDPAQSWVWSRSDIDKGILESATPDDAIAIFQRLAKTPV